MYIAGITHTAKTEMRQIVVWEWGGGRGGGEDYNCWKKKVNPGL